MPTNSKGKIFERNFAQAAERQQIFCLRLNDSSQAYQADTKNKTHFTPHNKCDFLLHFKGIILPFELKSTKFKSISIQRTDEDEKTYMIKKHQIDSLIKLSQYDEVIAGFILNFRTEEDNGDIVDDNTYFISIQQFSNFLYENDKSSINKLDVINYGGIRLDCTKMRKYFTYDINKLLNILCENYWLENK